MVNKSPKEITLKVRAIPCKKMFALVDSCANEIQWHGKITKRKNGVFVLEDIFCYPQYVSVASVTTDDREYWKYICTEVPERMKPITMHGHSHVYLKTFRSGRDMEYQEGIASGLHDDEYFFFLIANKHHDLSAFYWDKDGEAESVKIVFEPSLSFTKYRMWAKREIEKFVRPMSAYAACLEV